MYSRVKIPKQTSNSSLAAGLEVDGDFGYSSAHESRLFRYSTGHQRGLEMSKFLSSVGQKKLARELASCGSYLLFRDYFTVREVRLKSGYFCNQNLLCPLCAIRRAARLLDSYMRRFEFLLEENPDARCFFVTLTVKNGEDLANVFEHLKVSLKRMYQARRDHLKNPSKNRHVEAAKAFAGVHSIEVKRGLNSRLYHPHVHCIWICQDDIDAQRLSDEWLHFTGDSYIVDVSMFDQKKAVLKTFLELFKYVLKFSETSLADNWHISQTLRRCRLVDSFGSFRGIKLDDLRDFYDDLPFVDLFYRYSHLERAYRLHSQSVVWKS